MIIRSKFFQKLLRLVTSLVYCSIKILLNNCHSLGADWVAIDKTAHIDLIVIPGLTRNPVLFTSITLLDAGSVIPGLIRDRHDGQKLSAFLNCDTVWEVGAQFESAWIPLRLCSGW